MDERAVGTVGRKRSGARLSEWTSYLVVVAATFAAMLVAFMGVVAGLDWRKTLPPPAIVNEVCADEKLKWLRDNPTADPNLLVVGSSVAWRNVDSKEFVARDPSARPLNGGMCHASMNQTEFVTGYLLRHFPAVRTVVAVVTPQDFIDCKGTPSQLFDPATADAYAFDRRWAYRFYVTQFDPVSLARDATAIRAMRDGRNRFDPLVMTPYGDGPLNADSSHGLVYRELAGYDPACFQALHGLAEMAASGGRRFLVAASPLNPAWSKRYDPEGRLHDQFVTGIQRALADTRAVFWDGSRSIEGDLSAFTDAIHVNWPAAQRYAAQLAAALDAVQGDKAGDAELSRP